MNKHLTEKKSHKRDMREAHKSCRDEHAAARDPRFTVPYSNRRWRQFPPMDSSEFDKVLDRVWNGYTRWHKRTFKR